MERLSAMHRRLGVGFVGSGFNTRFHIQAFQAIRDGDVRGVWSPNRERAESAAALARDLDVGDCKAYDSITDMVADPAIDAIWLSGPNQARVENVEEIVHAIRSGKGTLKGLACEKPLARNVAEAKQVCALVDSVGLKTGYLENQLFSPHCETGYKLLWSRGASVTGRPYLARAAEEHSGPHSPWFWTGALQGGGTLTDMMCHSALLIRHLLVKPGEPLSTVVPKRVTAHIASLKWSRPHYANILKQQGVPIDYTKTPSEDFASMHVEFETNDGYTVLGEATTSWSYVGPGLRLSAELLGPEYSMQWNSLEPGLKLFFSREVKGAVGEDLVEKQQAETGQMPVVPAEQLVYGYEAEDRHFCRVFLGLEQPKLTFADGLDVVKLLMTAYQSAEQGRTVDYPGEDLDTFTSAVSRYEWKQ
jgi:predicted dehydrogenase